jgi:hypothetical protein
MKRDVELQTNEIIVSFAHSLIWLRQKHNQII